MLRDSMAVVSLWKRMASIPLGRHSTALAHSGERADPDSDCCSSVGSQLEGLLCHVTVTNSDGSHGFQIISR